MIFLGGGMVAPAAAAPGDSDAGFGTNGVASAGKRNASVVALAQQGDQKTLSLIQTHIERPGCSAPGFALARFSTRGILDQRFGQGGIVSADPPPNSCDGWVRPSALTIQADGSIFVFGSSGGPVLIAKFRPDGVADRSFASNDPYGSGTFRRTSEQGDPKGALVQPDGSMVVAGVDGNSSHCSNGSGILAKYRTTGQLDPNFGQAGIACLAASPSPRAFVPTAVAQKDDGSFVLAGFGYSAGSGRACWMAQCMEAVHVLRDGSVDTNFGDNGLVTLDVPCWSDCRDPSTHGSRASSVAVDSRGGIILGGTNLDFYEQCVFGQYPCSQTDAHFLLARLTPTGRLDTSFGSGGTVTTMNGWHDEHGDSVAVDAAGNILQAGYLGANWADQNAGRHGSALVRYTARGSTDPTFGSYGRVVKSEASNGGQLLLQPDNGILMGSARCTGAPSPGCSDAVFRFANGTLPPPPPDPPRDLSYLSIGDSIASGEGINYGWSYSPDTQGTDGHWTRSSSGEPTWDGGGNDAQLCHRSSDAYGPLVASGEKARSYSSFACTGASALKGILKAEPHKDHDPTAAQVGSTRSEYDLPNAAYDNAHADVVTLTLGADDVDFADVVAGCYEKFRSPEDIGDCDTPAERSIVGALLEKQKANLSTVLQEISDRGAAAGRMPLVLLTTYYDPFPPAGTRCRDTRPVNVGAGGDGVGAWLSDDEISFLRTSLHRLNDNITSMAAGYPNVRLVDLRDLMEGNTWCTTNPWVYGPSLRLYKAAFASNGHALDVPNLDNPAPFHPTKAGQEAIAQRIETALGEVYRVSAGRGATTTLNDGTKIAFDAVSVPGVVTATPDRNPPGENPFASAYYFRVTTSARYSGSITISVPSSHPLTLYHYHNGAWEAVPSTYANGMVTGTVTSLSPFALATAVAPASARFQMTGGGDAPAIVSFDASDSTGGSAAVSTYSWDFGDGTAAKGMQVSHRYLAAGTYTVRLHVVSAAGSTADQSKTVTVSNPPPVARIDAPASSAPGAVASMSGARSSDSNGTITSWLWDFGDGTHASGMRVEHTYSQPGTYTARVVVVDDGGKRAAASSDIVVTQPSGGSTLPPTGSDPPPPTGASAPPFNFPGPNSVFPPGGAQRPDLAPVLSSLRIVPRQFRAARRGPTITRSVGSYLTYQLSGQAMVSLTVARVAPGRRQQGRCRPVTQANRRAQSCSLTKLIHGLEVLKGKSGANGARFSGRWDGRTLRPGNYVLLAEGVGNTGLRSVQVSSSFTIRR